MASKFLYIIGHKRKCDFGMKGYAPIPFKEVVLLHTRREARKMLKEAKIRNPEYKIYKLVEV